MIQEGNAFGGIIGAGDLPHIGELTKRVGLVSFKLLRQIVDARHKDESA
jgi:hypothetical protein